MDLSKRMSQADSYRQYTLSKVRLMSDEELLIEVERVLDEQYKYNICAYELTEAAIHRGLNISKLV